MNVREVSRGIPHIEDLSLKEFLNVVSNLNEYEVTEKVDGAQILFGIDQIGFYTSRETKGGKRIYSVEDYKVKFSTTYMRSVHVLLESVLPELRDAGLKPGDQVEAEVLYGELPNVIPYSADRNHLIFLRTTEGTVSIDRLKLKLNGHSLPITLNVPFTSDGKTIGIREESNLWKFSRVPIIEQKFPSLKRHIVEMKKFLNTEDPCTKQVLGTIIETPLNKIPEWVEPPKWKTVKELIKTKREYIGATLREVHILPIKEILLNQFVRKASSPFGPSLTDGGFIEGVVLKNADGKMIKIVDKNQFGIIREDAWRIRNQLTENAKSIDGDHSFLGDLHVSLARALGHAPLGTIQAKRYLASTDILTEELDTSSIREYWLNVIELKEAELTSFLDKYEKEEMEVNNDERNMVDKAIFQRTRETFAETYQTINRYRTSTIRAKKPVDLLMMLIGKHLT